MELMDTQVVLELMELMELMDTQVVLELMATQAVLDQKVMMVPVSILEEVLLQQAQLH